MKKIICLFAIFLCLSCMLFCFSFKQDYVFASSEIKVLAFGDGISAGYAPDASPYNDNNDEEQTADKRKMLADYENYYNSQYASTVSESAYTYFFGKKVKKEAIIKSYANAYDTSGDLLKILSKNFNKNLSGSNSNVTILNQNVIQDVESADIITLCIGANDIFDVAKQKISEFFYNSSNLTYELSNNEILDYEESLVTKVNEFRDNYSKILEALNSRSKIFVMTIYNPYKYSSVFVNIVAYNQIMNSTIRALNEINEEIRQSANKNVIVVDVEKFFSNINEEDYKLYVNVDMSQATSNDIANLQNYTPCYLDPHPTPLGQKTISNLFTKSYNDNYNSITTREILFSILFSIAGFGFCIVIYVVVEKIKFRKIKF